MKKTTWMTTLAMGAALQVQAGWTLVDNFDTYDNSSITGVGAQSDGDATGGVWDGVYDGTGNARIYDSASDATDNELEVWGLSSGSSGWRGASTDLANNFAEDLTFADSSTNTLFFQFSVSGSDSFDCMFGLTDSQSVLDNTDSWRDFAVMPFLSGGVAGVADFKATTSSGDAVAIENVTTGIWYNVWLVVDTVNNVFDVYTSTGTDAGTLAISDAVFRNSKGLTSLAAFGLTQNLNGTVRVDNIYADIGSVNVTHPVPLPTDIIYYDDFSGAGSASLNATMPDTTTDGAVWSAHASILDNGTPVNANDGSALLPIALESNRLYRLTVELTPGAVAADNDWLGFGFNAASAVSSAGSTPDTNAGRFTDSGQYGKVWAILRESTSGGSDDIQFFSSVTSGEITTTETDAGFDGLVSHTAIIELGTTNGILTARMLVDDEAITSGFQTVSGVAIGDINGVGITHNNTTQSGVDFASFTLEVGTTLDEDGDGISDLWELLIVDADSEDAIESIQDVLPDDDFDGDGFTNLQEYEMGLDPTVADAADTDSDADYLPDVWELSELDTLTYNSYDDPDGDGYNNQAERIGGTDPLLDTDAPDFAAPSVAYMRDSVVATNGLLMAGGSYGRAINGISYQEQILYSFDGYQYTAWYDTVDSVQKICLARRTVKDTAVGEWEIVQTDSEFLNGDESSWDAHNVISFGICATDGTLHMAWDHHNNTLRYRCSVAGLCTTNKDAWGSDMLKDEQNWLVDSSTIEYDVTYPQFIATPDGGLMLDRRIGISGNGDQLFQVYDPAAGAWNEHVEFISRDGTYTGPDPYGITRTATERCAYINGFDIDTDGTIHVTWTWRESASQYGNRDICYAYSPDMGVSWYNNAGALVADTSLGEHITKDSDGITIVDLNMRQLLINQQTQCVDNDGRVHAMMLHRRQDPGYEPAVYSRIFSTRFTAYYHYFRNPETGEWSQRRIPPDDYPVGSRPRIGYDAEGNVYAAYLSYPAGSDVFPGYREDDDYSPLVIASASKASDYTDWAVQQVIDADFDGEPLFDQARLLEDGILAVYIQEHDTYTSGDGIPTPLHVYEFAVGVPQPKEESEIVLSFMGDDIIISAFGNASTNYQLQVSEDLNLTNGWSAAGRSMTGNESLLALPDAGGLQTDQAFYRVLRSPAP